MVNIDLLDNLLGDHLDAKSGKELRFCCPFCTNHGKKPDNKYHLFINSDVGIWNCFRCGEKGNYKRLSYLLQFSIESGVDVAGFDDTINRFLNHGNFESGKENPVVYSGMPDDIMKIEPYMKAYGYLLSRDLSHDDIQFYNIHAGIGKLRNRVVIPDMFGESCRFWTARLYDGFSSLKYFNPPLVKKSEIVFNIYNAKRVSNEVIITEGVFSAFSCGRNGVATYGKAVSDSQILQLVSFNFDKYIVALDSDAMYEALKLSSSLKSFGCNVYIIDDIPHGHDPSSIGKENFKHYLDRAKPYNSYYDLEKKLFSVTGHRVRGFYNFDAKQNDFNSAVAKLRT